MSHPKIYALPKSFLKTALMCFIFFVIAIGASIGYTNYVDRKSNQAWCELINGLNTRYSNLPANAPQEARDFAIKIAHLKAKLEC